MNREYARVVAGRSGDNITIVAAGATSSITSTTPATSRTARRRSEEHIDLLMQEVVQNTSTEVPWKGRGSLEGKNQH
jgi:hypothetical protein